VLRRDSRRGLLLYFLPQMQTKIHDEGWGLVLAFQDHGPRRSWMRREIIDLTPTTNAGVMATSQGGASNPYKLGGGALTTVTSKTGGNKGQFPAREWGRVRLARGQEALGILRLGLGPAAKILRGSGPPTSATSTFIDEFSLTRPSSVRENKLFSFGVVETRNEPVRGSDIAGVSRLIKEKLLFQLTQRGAIPSSTSKTANLREPPGELLLKHEHQGGRSSAPTTRKRTLRSAGTPCGKTVPVCLSHHPSRASPAMVRFDGRERTPRERASRQRARG